jgi:hypothetical protein
LKQAIETKVAIIEEQEAVVAKKKPWYNKAWQYITGAIVLIAAILAIIWYVVDLK